MVTQWAKTAFLAGLRGLRGGTLTLKCPDRMYRFGADDDLDATLVVHDERFATTPSPAAGVTFIATTISATTSSASSSTPSC